MGVIENVLKKHQQEILEVAERYINSAEGKKLIEKAVKDEIKAILEDFSIDEFFTRDNSKLFYNALEKAFIKRFKL